MAIREVAGNWIPGMTSQMLMKKIQKNSVARNGAHFFPASSPITSTAMLCSTSSKPDSATFWTPLGTSARLRLPAMKSTEQMIVETKHINATLLNPPGPKLRQSNRSLTPEGKSSASTITVTPSSARRSGRAGGA